jgi:hypothetical protein
LRKFRTFGTKSIITNKIVTGFQIISIKENLRLFVILSNYILVWENNHKEHKENITKFTKDKAPFYNYAMFVCAISLSVIESAQRNYVYLAKDALCTL